MSEASGTGGTILRLVGVAKRFGEFEAIRGVSLDIRDGEFLTIVGPSGSGKTTLIRILVGLEEPGGGEVWLRDRRVDRVPANLRPTCMVFQSLALFPHRTVGQNIEFPLKIRGVGQAARSARAMELLDLLRLPRDFHGKRVDQCSGGERQRVALARALAFDPEILFFDEPLSALDYRLRKTLEKELRDLHQATGKTFVYITHSLEEAMIMSDRIAIMRGGRLEQVATADEIYAAPTSRFVAEFMGEVNLFDVEGDGAGGVRSGSFRARPGTGVAGAPGAGRHATLMVRPEFVRFLAEGEEADFTVDGTLHAGFVLGSRMQYAVDAGDSQLTVERLREDRPRAADGDRVRIGWDARNVHLIPGEGGEKG